MAKSTNLNLVVGADTSQFKSELTKAKNEIRAFDKASSDALGKLGSLIGVDTRQIQGLTDAFGGMTRKMADAGKDGATAMGKIAASLGGVATGLAGLGIGAAVAGFKLLNDEAANFKKTLEGATIDIATNAYVDTFTQAMHDAVNGTGRSAAQLEAEFKKGSASFLGMVKNGIVNAWEGSGFNLMGGMKQSYLQAVEASAKGAVASELATQLHQAERQQKADLVDIAKLDVRIAELRLKAKDETASTAERLAAIKEAQELISQKYDKQAATQKTISDLMQQMLSLSGSTEAEVDAANAATVAAIRLDQQRADETRALVREQKKLTSEAEKEAQVRAKMAADQQALLAKRDSILSTDLSVSDAAKDLGGSGLATMQFPATIIPQVDTAAAQEAALNLTNIAMQAGLTMSEAIGSLVGDLLTGGDAWGNFGNAAISALGDMAIAVGKLAVATGVAALGIEEALHLNPYVAIAAGAALVALGAAVKAGLSNVAGGNYSAASSGIASSSTSASSAFTNQVMQINITGKLEASGSSLVAVLNSENARYNHTT